MISLLLLFFILALDYEDDKDSKTKTPSSRKSENEGIQQILTKTVRQAGLILLIDGEVGWKIVAWRDLEGAFLFPTTTSTTRPVS